jgi:hypothetical protein
MAIEYRDFNTAEIVSRAPGFSRHFNAVFPNFDVYYQTMADLRREKANVPDKRR